MICKSLSSKEISALAIEKAFLKKVAESTKEQPVAIQRGAKYRQAVGLSVFIAKLKMIATKYGISILEVTPGKTTSICMFCKSDIEFGSKRSVRRPGCQRLVDIQDNAASNIRVEGEALCAAGVSEGRSDSVDLEAQEGSLQFPLSIVRMDRGGTETGSRCSPFGKASCVEGGCELTDNSLWRGDPRGVFRSEKTCLRRVTLSAYRSPRIFLRPVSLYNDYSFTSTLSTCKVSR